MHKLDRKHIQQHFNHAAVSYDEAAVLQKRVAAHLDERLELVTLEPQVIVDIGAGTGILTEKMIARYPKARKIAIDLSVDMLRQAQQKLTYLPCRWLPTPLRYPLQRLFNPTYLMNADAADLPLVDGSVDLIVTNLMLQWCDDLDQVFAEFRRILKPEGLLMLTTFGPDTLRELRQAWSAVDAEEHVNTFIDMHDIGDALIRNGFGQPVMDVETFTLTYDKPIGVLRDLKAIGATNAFQRRNQGLMGKHRFTEMLNAYDSLRNRGKVPATYEVVHGHAWAATELVKGPNRDKSGVVEITLDDFSSQMRKSKKDP